MMRGRSAAAVGVMVTAWAALWSAPAAGAGLLTEVTVGRAWTSVSLLGDVSVVDDRVALTLGYTGARTSRGAPLSHQLALGADWSPSMRWLLMSMVSLSPSAISSVPITGEVTFHSANRSTGATIAAAYDSGGISPLEWGLDASVSGTQWAFVRRLRTPQETISRTERLRMLRPAVGGILRLAWDWELSARGALYLYSSDPLQAGRFTEEELAELERRFAFALQREGVNEALARYALQTLGGRLLQADAASGLPAAPVQWELRLGAARYFGSRWKGQLSWLYARYVPTQGTGHVLSTRWTFNATDEVRLWSALSLQVDVPEGERPISAALATVGGEVRF